MYLSIWQIQWWVCEQEALKIWKTSWGSKGTRSLDAQVLEKSEEDEFDVEISNF